MLASTIQDALDRFNATTPWVSIKLGPPSPEEEGQWVRLEDASRPEIARRLTARLRDTSYPADPLDIVGNYTFRSLGYVPLLIQGWIFLQQRRVVHLTDALLVRDSDVLQEWRLIEARATVMPDDPLAEDGAARVVHSEAELCDELFAEIRRAYQPLIESFRSHRYVAVANAWGTLLDSLAEGMLAAGRQTIGLEETWARWEATIAGRSLPARRRPRRHEIEVAGVGTKDVLVRASCCLWYMTDEAKTSTDLTHCFSCYLTSAAERVAYCAAHQESLSEHADDAS